MSFHTGPARSLSDTGEQWDVFVWDRVRRRLRVTANRVRRKRRQAHRNVLGALGLRRAVTDPFPGRHMHDLTSMYLEHGRLGLDSEHAGEHECELIKLRGLPRLFSAGRAFHAGHTELIRARVHPPHVLLNAFRLVPCGCDNRWILDQSHHRLLAISYQKLPLVSWPLRSLGNDWFS